ncbi:MAG: site-2 protease family protein [Dehalococcoidia bacterium]|nr:site-2 protease family protein [Dehalococcoidia bacterium]
MLLRLLAEWLRDPSRALANWVALPDILLLALGSLLIGLTAHESAHALAALWLGDTTARDQGRISANPLRHLDPVGLVLLIVVGVGWGRPAPVRPERLRFGPMRGMALVALAGPVTNVLLAALFAAPVRLGWLKWHSPFLYPTPFAIPWDTAYVLADIVGYLVLYNVLLATFNLIPIAPLDGARLLGFFLPARAWPWLARYELIGPMVLAPVILALLALDLATGGARLVQALTPLANALTVVLVGRPLV